MKLCTYVHLLIPNHIFCKLNFYETCLKKQCAVFGSVSWCNQNWGPPLALLLPHTVVAVIYTLMWLYFKQCLKQRSFLQWKSTAASITDWSVVTKLCKWSRMIICTWLFDCLVPSLLLAAIFLFVFFMHVCDSLSRNVRWQWQRQCNWEWRWQRSSCKTFSPICLYGIFHFFFPILHMKVNTLLHFFLN